MGWIIRKQAHILTDEEFTRLKHYIEHKYQSLDPTQRAEILANAVHRGIEGRIPTIPDEQIKQVCYELLTKHNEPLVIQALEREYNELDTGVGSKHTVASEPVVRYWNKPSFNLRIGAGILSCCAVILIFLLMLPEDMQPSASELQAGSLDMPQLIIEENVKRVPTDGIPKELEYVSIDTQRLQQYLNDRNSILAEEPYLSAIVEASKEFNIHPLLLFAITGQEQGLVPKNHKRVNEIANNPFNVFGSWESYNTTIESSATIAAKTVFNISGRRPGVDHPIQWLNDTYAEDPNWWKGVTWFFDEMKREIEGQPFDWPNFSIEDSIES